MNEDFLKCRDCVDLLLDYIDGNLPEEMEEQLDEHFEACPPCKNFLNSYKTSTEMMHKLDRRNVQVPNELQGRLKAFLRDNI